jgi:hypothetical protein
MLEHAIAPIVELELRQTLDATMAWCPVLATTLARIPHGHVYRDAISGALLFEPQPDIAPLAFQYVLFPAAEEEILSQFQSARHISVPQPYRNVLLHANGLQASAIQLFGVPSSRNAATGLLEDWLFQPLQLELAQRAWRLKLGPLSDQFMVGSLYLSPAQNSSLLLSALETYCECDGHGDVIAYYPSLNDVMESALERSYVHGA